jgi:hypothetical protein
MSIEECEYCDFRLQRSSELTRHFEICRVRFEQERRVKSWLNLAIVHDHRKEARKWRRNNNFDVDEKKTFISTNENFDDSENEITNEMIVNDDTSKFNDVFLLSIRSSILSIFFFLRIKSYKKTTHRKIETIIDININNDDSQFMLETEKKNRYESFQNEKNYAFAHWLHQSENSKNNVDRFFQNSRLNKFHQELSFKNDDQWLNKLNKITTSIQKNTWLKQNLIIVSKIDDESDEIVTIQYWNVMKTIKFFINHSFFRANLTYVSIRQFNDNDERVRTKMHIKDWWWNKQNEILEKTTIISLLIANDKIMLFEHQNDRMTWFVYFIIKNLSRQMKRNQTRLNDVLLSFISHAQFSSKNRMKTQIWHQNLSFMLKRKDWNSFSKSRMLIFISFQLLKIVFNEKMLLFAARTNDLENAFLWLRILYVIMKNKY